jgi:hypothetical protein
LPERQYKRLSGNASVAMPAVSSYSQSTPMVNLRGFVDGVDTPSCRHQQRQANGLTGGNRLSSTVDMGVPPARLLAVSIALISSVSTSMGGMFPMAQAGGGWLAS